MKRTQWSCIMLTVITLVLPGRLLAADFRLIESGANTGKFVDFDAIKREGDEMRITIYSVAKVPIQTKRGHGLFAAFKYDFNCSDRTIANLGTTVYDAQFRLLDDVPGEASARKVDATKGLRREFAAFCGANAANDLDARAINAKRWQDAARIVHAILRSTRMG